MVINLCNLLVPEPYWRICFLFARCHGEKGNVVYKLAKDHSLLAPSSPDYTSFNFVRSNSEEIPKNIGDKLSKLYLELMFEKEYDMEKREHKGSLGNFFAEK